MQKKTCQPEGGKLACQPEGAKLPCQPTGAKLPCQPAHKVRRVLVGSSIQNQNMQYTEMTHIHKFRSLRTKVRSVLVGISNHKQRHAMNLQTAHRRKGSWLDKWVPLGGRKRQTTPKPQPAHYFEASAQQKRHIAIQIAGKKMEAWRP